MSVKIFVVFLIVKNEYSLIQYDVINLCATLEVAQRIIDDIVNDTVTKEHNDYTYYTYVGNRNNCKHELYCDKFDGYVIEEMNVDDAVNIF